MQAKRLQRIVKGLMNEADRLDAEGMNNLAGHVDSVINDLHFEIDRLLCGEAICEKR